MPEKGGADLSAEADGSGAGLPDTMIVVEEYCRTKAAPSVMPNTRPKSESKNATAWAGRVDRTVTTERGNGESSHTSQKKNNYYAVFHLLFFIDMCYII